MQGGGDTTNLITNTEYTSEKSWELFDVSATFKSFLEGTQNYGFLIISDDKGGWCESTAREYVSANDETNKLLRPKIVIRTKDTDINTSFKKLFTIPNIVIRRTTDGIRVLTPFTNYMVTITNLKGQPSFHFKENNRSFTIPFYKLAPGVQLINIKHNNQNTSGKFIVP